MEFSIQSNVRGWYTIEHDTLGNPKKHSFRNDLSRYATRRDLLDVFASLADHYFHFKYFEPDKRKDRCKDKELFHFRGETEMIYHVEKVATAKPESKDVLLLLRRLQAYRLTHFDENLRAAADTLINALEDDRLKGCTVDPHDRDEIELLQRLIQKRIEYKDTRALTELVAEVKAEIAQEKLIWYDEE